MRRRTAIRVLGRAVVRLLAAPSANVCYPPVPVIQIDNDRGDKRPIRNSLCRPISLARSTTTFHETFPSKS